jgi:hypothetical protein
MRTYAFILVQPLERGGLLRQLAAEAGRPFWQLFGSLKNVAQRLLDSVRFIPWEAGWFDAARGGEAASGPAAVSRLCSFRVAWRIPAGFSGSRRGAVASGIEKLRRRWLAHAAAAFDLMSHPDHQADLTTFDQREHRAAEAVDDLKAWLLQQHVAADPRPLRPGNSPPTAPIAASPPNGSSARRSPCSSAA